MYCRWLEHYNFGFDDVLFGTISWRRTHESLRVAFPHVSPRFTFALAFWEAFFVGCFLVLFVLGCVCVCVGFDGSPRCRDFVVFFPTS